MATLEDEIKDLKEKNNELAQKAQYWKVTAAERDNEKLALMKENNELRLKLSMLRNNGGLQARKLDEALQRSSEKAISLLIEASEEIAKSRKLAKEYMRDRQELDSLSPRWSTLGGTPTSERKDKVHRVPPLMMGGQSLQPVVALSRTMMNTSGPRTSTTRSPNQNHSITERAMPVHMLLQDVYIPLTRINVSDLPNNNMETDTDNNAEDSEEVMGLEDVTERLDESEPMLDDQEFQGRQLDAVSEEEAEELATPSPVARRRPSDNPLEGPSWLLDKRTDSKMGPTTSSMKLEPDSTTELDVSAHRTSSTSRTSTVDNTEQPGAFTPTVRRRKRTSTPPLATPRQHYSPPLATPRQHYSPRPNSARRNSINGRVLKVMVAKMRLDESPPPPKRVRSPLRDLLTFDAPSPNGATDSAVIVSETRNPSLEPEVEPNTSRSAGHGISFGTQRARLNSQENRGRRPSHDHDSTDRTDISEHRSRLTNQDSRVSQLSRVTAGGAGDSAEARDSRDSDSGSAGDAAEGRVRRARKMVTYKEKPLNRKLRR